MNKNYSKLLFASCLIISACSDPFHDKNLGRGISNRFQTKREVPNSKTQLYDLSIKLVNDTSNTLNYFRQRIQILNSKMKTRFLLTYKEKKEMEKGIDFIWELFSKLESTLGKEDLKTLLSEIKKWEYKMNNWK